MPHRHKRNASAAAGDVVSSSNRSFRNSTNLANLSSWSPRSKNLSVSDSLSSSRSTSGSTNNISGNTGNNIPTPAVNAVTRNHIRKSSVNPLTSSGNSAHIRNRNEHWDEVARSLVALFQMGKMVDSIEHLNELIRLVKSSDAGPFIIELYKPVLCKCMIIIRQPLLQQDKTGLEFVVDLQSVWSSFYSFYMPHLEAILVPVRHGTTKGDLSIRQIALLAFRDHVVLNSKLHPTLEDVLENGGSSLVPCQIVQMLLVINSVQVADYNQRLIHHLLRLVVPFLPPRLYANSDSDSNDDLDLSDDATLRTPDGRAWKETLYEADESLSREDLRKSVTEPLLSSSQSRSSFGVEALSASLSLKESEFKTPRKSLLDSSSESPCSKFSKLETSTTSTLERTPTETTNDAPVDPGSIETPVIPAEIEVQSSPNNSTSNFLRRIKSPRSSLKSNRQSATLKSIVRRSVNAIVSPASSPSSDSTYS